MPVKSPDAKAKHALYMKAYREKHREKFLAADRARYRKQGWRQRQVQRAKKSGWTAEAVEQALKDQDGRCAICAVVLESGRGANALAADHDHVTGRRRKLLCNICNALEGLHLRVALDEEEWGRRIKAYRAEFRSE